MNAILEYILANYTWILIGSIIILLAIIGWYADNTNFGQGKKNNEDNSSVDLSGKKLNDVVSGMSDKKLLDENSNNKISEEATPLNQTINNTTLNTAVVMEPVQLFQNANNITQSNNEMNFDPMTGQPLNTNNVLNKVVDEIEIEFPQTEVKENNDTNVNGENKNEMVFDNDFERFDEKFNELVPEKEIIDDGLLEDIENISLDKTQKLDLSDIPDLGDVELPRIKNMKSDDKGIWKF